MNSSCEKVLNDSSGLQKKDVASVSNHLSNVDDNVAYVVSNSAEISVSNQSSVSICNNATVNSTTSKDDTENASQMITKIDTPKNISHNGIIYLSGEGRGKDLKKGNIINGGQMIKSEVENCSDKSPTGFFTAATVSTATTFTTAVSTFHTSTTSSTSNITNSSLTNSSKRDDSNRNVYKSQTSNLKKKSFTLFSKSSKLKDFLMNKNGKKQAKIKKITKDDVVNKGSGDDGVMGGDSRGFVENFCKKEESIRSESNSSNNVGNNESCSNGKFKSIFRINKNKLTKLHLPHNKGSCNKHQQAEGDEDNTSRNSNSSNSIVTPSPTTFSHANHNNPNNFNNAVNNDDKEVEENGDVEDNNGEDCRNNRPTSFDIRTRDLPELPLDSVASRGGIRSAEISQQHQLTLQQQHSLQQATSSSSSSLPWQQNRSQNSENDGQLDCEGKDPFIESFNELKNKGWYWGPLSWKEAEEQLKDKPIGSFLVRDSSDERYILSLSFKSEDQTHHTRIEHYRGQFSFNAQPRSHGAATIVEFIEKAIGNCTDGSFSYFLRPKGPGLPPTMVRLTNPVSRLMKTHSLQHLCRFVVLSQIRRDLIDTLPVPNLIKAYLACNQYYVEGT